MYAHSPPSEQPRSFEAGVWLQGGGSFIQVNTTLIEGVDPLSIKLALRTFTANGLVLAVYNLNMTQVHVYT